jgi:tetratricopeptide (TPR) repeat protein
MKSSPGSKDLLQLLSILPDGLSDAEIIQSNLPIQNVLRCKSALLGVSLAYYDSRMRLKVLAPIRDYMEQFYPPSAALIQPLCQHFHLLLNLYRRYYGTQQMGGIMARAAVNFGNLNQVLQRSLRPDYPDLADTIRCAIAFNACHRISGQGGTALLDDIPAVLPQPCDHELEALFITEAFNSFQYRPIVNPALLIDQAKLHFDHLNDPSLEGESKKSSRYASHLTTTAKFYTAVGHFHRSAKHDNSAARIYLKKAITLAQSCGDTARQSNALTNLAELECHIGEYSSSLTYAREAAEIANLSGNLHGEAMALRVEGICFQSRGDFKNAILRLHRARERLELCGVSGGNLEIITMNDEAQVHLLKSEYVEASTMHNQIVQIISAERDPALYASSIMNFAELDILTGASALDVLHNLDKAKSMYRAMKSFGGLASLDAISADLELREGNTATANVGLQGCITSMRGHSSELVAYCLERLANVTLWEIADFESASAWTVIYLAEAQKSTEYLDLHKSLLFLGDVFLSNGDETTAHNLFVVALDGFTAMDVHRSRAQCMIRLGDLAKQHGDLSKAVELWNGARPLFERSLQLNDAAKIDSRLAAVDEAHENPQD